MTEQLANVLVVEDNETGADMLRRRLERRGFVVQVASGGLAALDIARVWRPDVILMDLSLPDIDGWEATRRLKDDATTSRIPVVALTAHAFLSDRDQAMAAGCDDFETKPVNFESLVGKVAALLARRGVYV
jgi:CheY-like chemotaxis protein